MSKQQKLAELFNIFAECQALSDIIIREHNDRNKDMFAGDKDAINRVIFDDQLTNISDQRDAYGHLSSMIAVQEMLLKPGDEGASQAMQKLSPLTEDNGDKTKFATSLKCTASLRDELKAGFESNAYEEKNVERAKELLDASTELYERLDKMNVICQSFKL